MMESNNIVSLSDWKVKKNPEKKKELEKAREIVSSVKADQLEEQPLASAGIPEDNYTKFVTNPVNASKIQSIIDNSIKSISSYFPEITACRFGDVLFLKEAVVSLIMRSALYQDHPFQVMADKLEITFNKGMNDGSSK